MESVPGSLKKAIVESLPGSFEERNRGIIDRKLER